MKTIDESINQLEELVNSAKTMPFANKSLVDADKVKDIIQDMRNNMPEEIKRARYIDNEKDKIIADANAKANDIISTAEERSKSLLQTTDARVKTLTHENNITQQAMKEAKLILSKAQAKADNILANANKQSEEMLSNATKKSEGLKKATNDYIMKNMLSCEQVLMDSLDGIRKTKSAINNATKKSDEL
jgi:vacuolar-type H+-ATPase subunit H